MTPKTWDFEPSDEVIEAKLSELDYLILVLTRRKLPLQRRLGKNHRDGDRDENDHTREL